MKTPKPFRAAPFGIQPAPVSKTLGSLFSPKRFSAAGLKGLNTPLAFKVKGIAALDEVTIPLTSSNLRSVSYSRKTKKLTVVFRRANQRYVYLGVPLAIYNGLMKAQSKGVYFHQHIRFSFKYKEL